MSSRVLRREGSIVVASVAESRGREMTRAGTTKQIKTVLIRTFAVEDVELFALWRSFW